MTLSVSFGLGHMHGDCSQGCYGRPQGRTPGCEWEVEAGYYPELVDSAVLAARWHDGMEGERRDR